MITDLKINEEEKQRYYEKGYWTKDTIADVWVKQVESCGSKLYVKDDQGASFTYEECNDIAARLASWLVASGVKPGDVVTIPASHMGRVLPHIPCHRAHRSRHASFGAQLQHR